MPTVVANKEVCSKDGLCLKECVMDNISIGHDGYPVSGDKCIMCGHCQAICPNDALTLGRISPETLELCRSNPVSPDNFSALVKNRRSIRKYKEQTVPGNIIDAMLDTVSWAPTGGNSGLVKWLIVEKKQTMRRISELVCEWAKNSENFGYLSGVYESGNDVILRGAPHLAIAYANGLYGTKAVDCAIAVTTLELSAASRNIGSCWAGFFMMAADYAPLKDYLKIPDNHKIHAALMFGYPDMAFKRIPFRRRPTVTKI